MMDLVITIASYLVRSGGVLNRNSRYNSRILIFESNLIGESNCSVYSISQSLIGVKKTQLHLEIDTVSFSFAISDFLR